MRVLGALAAGVALVTASGDLQKGGLALHEEALDILHALPSVVSRGTAASLVRAAQRGLTFAGDAIERAPWLRTEHMDRGLWAAAVQEIGDRSSHLVPQYAAKLVASYAGRPRGDSHALLDDAIHGRVPERNLTAAQVRETVHRVVAKEADACRLGVRDACVYLGDMYLSGYFSLVPDANAALRYYQYAVGIKGGTGSTGGHSAHFEKGEGSDIHSDSDSQSSSVRTSPSSVYSDSAVDSQSFAPPRQSLGHAYHRLGFLYSTGFGGVEPHAGKALLHYTFGAMHGHTGSQLALAQRNMNGIGTPKSCEGALRWYTAAVESAYAVYEAGPPGGRSLPPPKARLSDKTGGIYGHGVSKAGSTQIERPPYSPEIIFLSPLESSTDWDQQTELIQFYASRGDVRAKFHLAIALYSGFHGAGNGGVREAHAHTRPASWAPGPIPSIPRLHDGLGDGGADYKAAFFWFSKVAEELWVVPPLRTLDDHEQYVADRDRPRVPVLEHPDASIVGLAAYFLGKMYLRGEYVDANMQKAVIWLKRASTTNRYALVFLAQMLQRGHGFVRNRAAAQLDLVQLAFLKDKSALIPLAHHSADTRAYDVARILLEEAQYTTYLDLPGRRFLAYYYGALSQRNATPVHADHGLRQETMTGVNRKPGKSSSSRRKDTSAHSNGQSAGPKDPSSGSNDHSAHSRVPPAHSDDSAYSRAPPFSYPPVPPHRAYAPGESCTTALYYLKGIAEHADWAHDNWWDAERALASGDARSALLAYWLDAESGYEAAQTNAALLLEKRARSLKDIAAASLATSPLKRAIMKLWLRAGSQGNIDAQIRAADLLYKENPARALAIYTTAARRSPATAIAHWSVGYMHEHGLGTPHNYTKAAESYTTAAHVSKEAAFPIFLARTKLRVKCTLLYIVTMLHQRTSWVVDAPAHVVDEYYRLSYFYSAPPAPRADAQQEPQPAQELSLMDRILDHLFDLLGEPDEYDYDEDFDGSHGDAEFPALHLLFFGVFAAALIALVYLRQARARLADDARPHDSDDEN